MMYAYEAVLALALIIVCVSVSRRKNAQLARCAVALAVNWALGMAYSELIATDGFLFNLAIDSTTALIVLYRPAARWQAMLGVSYVVQIAAHLGYGARVLSAGSADAMAYYNWITVIAFVQLIVLGGWGVGNSRLARRRGRHNQDIAAPRAGRVAGA